MIEPTLFGDERGFFMESYNKRDFYQMGFKKDFVQDNHSKSKKGVLRGLHFQTRDPQGKLIRVIKGKVYDVAVDLRSNSKTKGTYVGTILSEENKKMFYIPEGFAHGFLTVSDEVEFLYKVTNYYNAEYDSGIIWNDSSINIKWPLEEYGIKKPIISQKDQNLLQLKEKKIIFEY